MAPRFALLTLATTVLLACAPRDAAPPQPTPPPQAWASAAPAAPPAPVASPPSPPCTPATPASAAAAPVPKGLLTVHSRPPGAMVFLRAVFLGGTPLEAREVDAGTAELLLVFPRLEPIFQAVTVRPGERVVLDLAFPSPPSAPAPGAGAHPRGAPGPDDSTGSSPCGWGDCMEECRQEKFDCGSSDLCEALRAGCVKRCWRKYQCR